VSSPDDAPDTFDRRIAEAARALRRRAPEGMLERIRERAADLDASIETAARALAGTAPLDALDVRIAAAARELRRPAPAGLYPAIRARARAQEAPRSPWIVVRNVAALAAALLVVATIVERLARRAAAAPHPGLLTSAALAQSLLDEQRLDREAERLEERVSGDAALAESDVAQSLLEEVAFLDEAIEQCRLALETSPAHGPLRARLVELTGRRVDLLRQIEAAGRRGAGESGEPRG
jgi:hypothetical protein